MPADAMAIEPAGIEEPETAKSETTEPEGVEIPPSSTSNSGYAVPAKSQPARITSKPLPAFSPMPIRLNIFISMGLRASEMPPCITSSANDFPVQGAQIAVSQHGMNRFRVAQIITIAITPV